MLLAGVEHVRIAPGITEVTPLDFVHYPVTHSLLTGIGWGALPGGVYARAGPRRRVGLLVFVGFLVVLQVAGYFGAPPPSVAAIAYVGLAQWLLPAWAHGIDRRHTAPGLAGSGPASGRASR